MKTSHYIIIPLLLHVFHAIADAQQFTNTYDNIVTLDGYEYLKASPRRMEGPNIILHHSKGIDRVHISRMPDEVLSDLGLPTQNERITIAKERQQWREQLQSNRYAEAVARVKPDPATFLGSYLKVGDVGRFKYAGRVIQVLGPDEMIVELIADVQKRVSRIASPSGMYDGNTHERLTYTDIKGDTVWIKGYSTQGVADNQKIKPDVVFKVTGTDSYTTALGSRRTLHTISPVE